MDPSPSAALLIPPARRSRRPVTPVAASGVLEVFRRSDIAAWGLDPGSVRTYVRQGLWVRLHHGVYADAGVVRECAGDPVRLHRLLTRAAIASLPVAAYAVGPTAAVVHELPLPDGPPATIHLVRDASADRRALSRRISSPTALVHVHVSGHALHEADVTEVDGLASVSREVAAVTTAAGLSAEWAVAVLDAVAWRRPEVPEVLENVTEDWPRLRGIGTVRRALPLVRTGAQSPLESLSRIRLVAGGLPEPALQVAFHDAAGLVGVADMVWEEWKVIGECDGLLKYSSREDLVREKKREDRLRALGYVVVRWTWDEIMRDPRAVVARIRRAFAVARGLGRAR